MAESNEVVERTAEFLGIELDVDSVNRFLFSLLLDADDRDHGLWRKNARFFIMIYFLLYVSRDDDAVPRDRLLALRAWLGGDCDSCLLMHIQQSLRNVTVISPSPYVIDVGAPGMNAIYLDATENHLSAIPRDNPDLFPVDVSKRRSMDVGNHATIYTPVRNVNVKVFVASLIVPVRRNRFTINYSQFILTDEQAFWMMKCVEGLYQTVKVTFARASLSHLRP